MQAKCLCVLICVWVEGGVGTVGPVWALQWNNFTYRFRAVLLLWIICVFSVLFDAPLCVSVYLCLTVACLGWILGSHLLCLAVGLSFSHWYPGSGVVLDCIHF